MNANGSTDAESGIKTGTRATPSRRQRLRRLDPDRQPAQRHLQRRRHRQRRAHRPLDEQRGPRLGRRHLHVTADSTAPSAAADGQRHRRNGAGSSSYLTSGTSVAHRARPPYSDARLRARERGADGAVGDARRRHLRDASGRRADDQRTRATPSRTATATASRSPRPTTSATSPSLTTTVKVDTTAPVAPAISFSGPLERQHVRQRHDALLPPVGRRHVHRERERRDAIRRPASRPGTPATRSRRSSGFLSDGADGQQGRRHLRRLEHRQRRAVGQRGQQRRRLLHPGDAVHGHARRAAPRPAACSRSTRTPAR